MHVDDIKKLVETPLDDFETLPRVEICIFHHSAPEVTLKCVKSIMSHTDWPYKLTVLDTSMYPAVMAKIYNESVQKSSCDYVAIVCSDAEVSQKWMSKMMEPMLTDIKIGTIGPLVTRRVNQKMIDLKEGSGLHVGFWDWVSLPVLVHNKKIFMEVGGYDERFFLYGHDPDLYKRLAEHGYKVCINTDAIATHEGGTTTRKIFGKEDMPVIEEYNNLV